MWAVERNHKYTLQDLIGQDIHGHTKDCVGKVWQDKLETVKSNPGQGPTVICRLWPSSCWCRRSLHIEFLQKHTRRTQLSHLVATASSNCKPLAYLTRIASIPIISDSTQRPASIKEYVKQVPASKCLQDDVQVMTPEMWQQVGVDVLAWVPPLGPFQEPILLLHYLQFLQYHYSQSKTLTTTEPGERQCCM